MIYFFMLKCKKQSNLTLIVIMVILEFIQTTDNLIVYNGIYKLIKF